MSAPTANQPDDHVHHERLARAVRIDIREFPPAPLSPLAVPSIHSAERGPTRVSVPGAVVDTDEMNSIAEAGWSVESYVQTFWDQEKQRFWQATIRTTDGRRYYADIDRRA